MRLLSAALLLALGVAAAAEEAAPAPLPPAATAVLDKLAKTQEKLENDHRMAKVAERQKAIDALQKVLKDVMKGGDLEQANAVNARIEELRKANEDDLPTDVLGNQKPPEPGTLVLGAWDFSKNNGTSGVLTFREDGTVGIAVTSPIQMQIQGRWQVVPENRIRFTHLGGWEELGFETPDKLVGDSADAGKKGIRATRRKEAKGR